MADGGCKIALVTVRTGRAEADPFVQSRSTLSHDWTDMLPPLICIPKVLHPRVGDHLAAFVLVALLAAGTTARASLVGDSFEGQLLFKDFPSIGNMFDPQDAAAEGLLVPPPPESSGIQPLAVVTDSDTTFPELIFEDTYNGQQFLIVTADVDADAVHVRVANTTGQPPTAAPYGWEIHLVDLQPTVPMLALVGATVVDDAIFPGLTASVTDLGTRVVIDFPGRDTGTPGTGPAELAQLVLDVYAANDQLVADVNLHFVPAGDYNANGKVDAADYTVWRDHLNMSGTLGTLMGDGTTTGDLLGTSDGFVDEWDFLFWRQQFGNTLEGSGAGAALSIVPEPSLMVLLLQLFALALLRRSGAVR